MEKNNKEVTVSSYLKKDLEKNNSNNDHNKSLRFTDIQKTSEILANTAPEDLLSSPMSARIDIENHKAYLRTEIYKTDLNFVKDIYGWRPGQCFLILAPKGWGKSTLNRTILHDLVKNGYIPLVYLSEDYLREYEISLSDLAEEFKGKVRFISEKDNLSILQEPNITPEQKIHRVASQIMAAMHKSKCDILLFDNITTSSCYDELSIKLVQAFTSIFAEIANKFDIPVIFFAHTRAEGAKIPFTSNDIRGVKTGANQTPTVGALYMREVQIGEGDVHRRSAIHWISIRGESKNANGKKYGALLDPETRRLGYFWEYDSQQFTKDFCDKIEFVKKDIDLTDHYEIFKSSMKKKKEYDGKDFA